MISYSYTNDPHTTNFIGKGKIFGDRVKKWITLSQPRVIAALRYDSGFFTPGRCSKTCKIYTARNSAIEPYL